MKKTALKAIFLGLLSRRRAADKSMTDRAATDAPQAATQSPIEPAPSDREASSAGAEAITETAAPIPQKTPGPPADWLAKYSSAPPPHWVERVRSAAPQLLQGEEWNNAGLAAPAQTPGQVQPRSQPEPPRLQRPASPPLRLQRPAQAPNTNEPSRLAHDRGTIWRMAAPQLSQDQKGNEAGPVAPAQTPRQVQLSPQPEPPRLQRPAPPPLRLQRPAQAPNTNEPSRLAHDKGTIWRTVPRISASVGRARENPQLSPSLPSNLDRAVAGDAPEPEDRGEAVPRSTSPDNVIRYFRTAPSNPARAASGGLVQSGRNSDEPEFRLVETQGTGAIRSNNKHEAPPHVPILSAARAQVMQFSRPQNPEHENVTRENIARYPDVIRRETSGGAAGAGRPAFKSGYRPVTKREEATKPMRPEVAQSGRDISHDAPAGRWPALFESAPADYFDDLKAALHELRHNRRLALEQEGALWSE